MSIRCEISNTIRKGVTMMNRTKITRTIALFLLCLCILSGCGRQKVEYGTDTGSSEASEPEAAEQATTLENEGAESDRELTGAIAKEIGAESTWEKEITWQKNTGGTGKVEINAEVDVPDADGMQVAKVSDRVFEPEVKKKVAEALFDTGTFVPVGNGGYGTKEEIMDQIKENQERLEEDLHPHTAADCKARIEKLQELYDNFAEPEKDDFEAWKYMGTKNGRSYTLTFEDVWQGSVMDEEGNYKTYEMSQPKLIFMTDYPTTYYGKENVIFGLTDEVGDFGENKATITKEQAEEIVKRFLETAEIDGMEIYECYDLNWGEYPDGTGDIAFKPIECNGYKFTLYRKVQNCFVTGKVPANQIDGTVYGGIHEVEDMSVVVTDEGIIEVTYYNPIQIEEVMTEHTELLSFENVKGVMEGYVPDRYSGYTTGKRNLDHMELNYCYSSETVIFDDEETVDKIYYYMIPVWSLYRLEAKTHNQTIFSSPPLVEGVAINAIDGSLLK